MTYSAVIQNKETKKYLSTKGYWLNKESAISVATRIEAYRTADRLNGVVLSCKLRRASGH